MLWTPIPSAVVEAAQTPMETLRAAQVIYPTIQIRAKGVYPLILLAQVLSRKFPNLPLQKPLALKPTGVVKVLSYHRRSTQASITMRIALQGGDGGILVELPVELGCQKWQWKM